MTTLTQEVRAELRTKAVAALSRTSDPWFDVGLLFNARLTEGSQIGEGDAAYIAAASPEAVIDLLAAADERDRLAERVEDERAEADHCRAVMLTAMSRAEAAEAELSRLREELAFERDQSELRRSDAAQFKGELDVAVKALENIKGRDSYIQASAGAERMVIGGTFANIAAEALATIRAGQQEGNGNG